MDRRHLVLSSGSLSSSMQLSEQGLVEVMDGGREADDDIGESREDYAFN